MKLSKRGMRIINKPRKKEQKELNYLRRLTKARLSTFEIILPEYLKDHPYLKEVEQYNKELKEFINNDLND
jgi:hypothetical protein